MRNIGMLGIPADIGVHIFQRIDYFLNGKYFGDNGFFQFRVPENGVAVFVDNTFFLFFQYREVFAEFKPLLLQKGSEPATRSAISESLSVAVYISYPAILTPEVTGFISAAAAAVEFTT